MGPQHVILSSLPQKPNLYDEELRKDIELGATGRQGGIRGTILKRGKKVTCILRFRGYLSLLVKCFENGRCMLNFSITQQKRNNRDTTDQRQTREGRKRNLRIREGRTNVEHKKNETAATAENER